MTPMQQQIPERIAFIGGGNMARALIGGLIRQHVPPGGISVGEPDTAAAAALGVSRPALSNLVNGKADLSGEMALRIEKAFGVKMDTLMRMQSAYDIAQARKCEKLIRVARVHVPAT